MPMLVRRDEDNFYNSIGPNPRLVKIFMEEKGITSKVPFKEVDLMAGDNRKEPYLKLNPAGQMPCLEMEDGRVIAEVTVICEYLNDKFSDGPDLYGASLEDRAETRMWLRRLDFNLEMPIFNAFRYGAGKEFFAPRLRVIPHAAEDLQILGQEKTMWLDAIIADGRKYLCGDRFTVADIWLAVILDFGAQMGQPINPEAKHVHAMLERIRDRPSMKVQ
ncbi:glutathione S-transferase domain-containing protein [Hyaloraphidium curvatum]|nr:glutathione S-transferase domain-containing protein [Hyaloraphidium curvatum]